MSSPIAKQKRNVIKDGLVRVHQDLSHTHRVDVLAREIAGEIESRFPKVQKIECLDVGCGDMKISENIHRHNPKTVWNCIDIHRLPDELRDDPRWKKYKEFDGTHLPFHDRSMDVVMFCDVLHHAGENIPALLRESARVGKTIIVKDHFEYSLYSRTMLKIMDFMGNWGYGIKLPDRYFTRQSFAQACVSSGLTVRKIITGIDLYSHLAFLKWLLRPDWQFIALLEPNEQEIFGDGA